ncbi:putative nuclease HARBI1 isoform X2 [Glycine soja]|nr:putative nuclease HARBI1 isoform X2 [Glycine soja]
MRQLVHTEKCRDIIRMGPEAFMLLCHKLRGTGYVKDTIRSTVEEQVAKFLHIIGHNVKNRTVSFFFRRSGETVSRHFHNVLRAIISLEDEFLVQPSGRDVPPQILNNSRFYPFFKDCIGAIDGTHIRVKVPRAEAARFRGRKDYPTQNVLAACNFDMKFTYVLPGWEGTASDSRILKDALSREDSLKIPEGKYYLGDAGFMLKRGVLTPYRGVRYHLKEYSIRSPQNSKELFNHRHASLRNVIERCFGVLKKRFPILSTGTEPFYSFEVMTDIVLACCILHNFLMGVDVDETLIAEVDRELLQQEIDRSQPQQQRDDDYRLGTILRDDVAIRMWNVYPI